MAASSGRLSGNETAGDDQEIIHTSYNKQQNLTEEFVQNFKIDEEVDNVNWFRSVKIAQWSIRFTKDGKIDEKMEKLYWEQEAKYHQPILISLTSFLIFFNFFLLICDLHPLFLQVTTPPVIKMRDFNEAIPVVATCRVLIFFILLYAKVTKFFVGPDCEYLKSKWKLLIGMFSIQIIEMFLTVYCIDKDPGMHCILLLIIFNFTPVRLVEKAPICIVTYVVWALSYFIWCFTWEENEQYKDLWGYPKESSGFLKDRGCTLCYNIINLLTIIAMFTLVQIYVVFIREEHLSQNLLAIKIGQAQLAIVNKRNRTNQMLLHSMLPQEITKELNISGTGKMSTNLDRGFTYVESYNDVTVLFCMINDFAMLSDTFNAVDLVSILNTTYSYFDHIADMDEISIYKVETVGEVYMMAGGCPKRTVKHAEYGASMALEMIKSIPYIKHMLKSNLLKDNTENHEFKEKLLDNFSIKIGLNSGQVTAGVIGATCQRFKLFGDTVNTASRMESRSLPGMCQVSDSTFKQLVKAKYLFKKREPMPIKGKGMMQTYFLVGKESEKDTVDHDKLSDLINEDDMLKFNFADVCRAAIKESQDKRQQAGDYGEMDAFSKAIQENSMLDDGVKNFSREERTYTMTSTTTPTAVLDEANSKQHYKSIEYRLTNRDAPQLPMNQTLLFLLGHEFQFIGPSAVEAMLETHYRHHVFCKERGFVRKIFCFFLACLVFLVVYDTLMLEHDIMVVILRYASAIPFLVAFIASSFHKKFFYYQQMFICLVCVMTGISIIIMGTYEAPYPGYGLLIILFLVILFLDSLFFVNRVAIVWFLTVIYCVCLNLYCVSYTKIDNLADHEAEVMNNVDPDALVINMTDIGNTFCAIQQDTDCSLVDDCANKGLYSKFVDTDDLLTVAVQTEMWKKLEERQTVAPFPALQQVIVICFYVGLAIYPSWVSNYFSRVCFNRVQKEHEMEREGKVAQANTTGFLNQLVPPSIVPLLSEGKFIATKLEQVTILFVDMVGFTKFSSQLDPDELVMFLNEMYSRFDVVLEKYSLYKVEIIGDALFAVAGAPEERYDKYHAARAVCAAHGLLGEIEKLQAFLEISVRIRIGVHTGSCVAGVVGIKDPRYHLFGVTVGNAEKIESTGMAGKIHVSQATVDSINESGASAGISFTLRDEEALPPLTSGASNKHDDNRGVAESKEGELDRGKIDQLAITIANKQEELRSGREKIDQLAIIIAKKQEELRKAEEGGEDCTKLQAEIDSLSHHHIALEQTKERLGEEIDSLLRDQIALEQRQERLANEETLEQRQKRLANEEKRNRYAEVESILEAKSRVGSSYFAEVVEEETMEFPNLM
ncbi:hypothetical protein TrVE_jg9645 [Triparma verrucosa]|uniref:Guanylate cyclase domain-containing protein n=1 Tax=Triparma verrucosa TaxID=1606542 RepID=A0A9W7KWH8_9STRA|nr:hypothetical protein TrVE_jg9645 [Triparma verrucosa]